MKTHKDISILDFSEFPGGRYREDGPNSGQRFREEFLAPALQEYQTVSVDLDGAMGYGSSFLEEAFGGLVRSEGFEFEDLKKRLTIFASTAIYKKRCWRYIKEAANGHS